MPSLPVIQGCVAKKVAARKHIIPRFTFQFWFSNKFSQSSMEPPPVLSEDEGQVSVRWIRDWSRKGFSQTKLGIQ